ncbi:hypothetical protein [Xanthobacter autotrophicus]|uniref:hypothetical protein n=1 Tax=Xanthobacter autotrophicus TaxID=280 RepID=UPI0024A705BF|nr:hypothetical protein [Xanthobacter autotrophicus]MDI4655558.1 hypothetical protein [Xanthobacter autotrophicus]
MKLFSLHMGETLVIGDTIVTLAERRNSRGGHHARLAVEAPSELKVLLRKRDGSTIGLAPTPIQEDAHDARPVFARR